MPREIPKAYEPQKYEDDLYAAWEQSGLFNPDNLPGERKEPYCIMMPPPNRTGTLHMGHAMGAAIQDLAIRFERLRGKKALYVPGTDHAAIATQVKVEQLLIKQGMKDPRRELGREEFLKRVVEFADASGKTIENQTRKLGASCDWSREAYTLDAPRNAAVNAMFKMMFEDGLIERGYRLVNWDPQFQTTLSDDEVLSKEGKAKLLTFAYDKHFPIAISTTRPETKFGDTAVAVHPDDARYAKFVGQTFTPTFCGKKLNIKIIADAAVDPSFGTGALGVTPAHSMIDAEMAERHGLETVVVIGKDGRLLPEAGEGFAGLTIADAREKVEKELAAAGLLVSVEEVDQNLPIAERGGAPVEQLPMKQWFVRVNKPFALRQDALGTWKKGERVTLKQLMLAAVESGQTVIIPEQFGKIYKHWINNLRDWCISRQIWFGHRIPVWYCLHCQQEKVNANIKSKWFLVRHGLTEDNKNNRLSGQSVSPLNEEGRAQVRSAAQQLKSQNIELIISSDINRCRETAEIIAEVTGAKIVFDQALRERNHGSFEGMDRAEAEKKHGNILLYDKKLMDEETHSELEERVAKAFGGHRNEHSKKNVVIVSHAGALRMLTKSMRNLTPEEAMARPSIKNAQIISLDHVDEPCTKCENTLFEQDPDTLDTWFSSGSWTFSALGWPDEKTWNKNRAFHPTALLETGRDIIFFWVARMVLMSTYALGEVPFRTAYLHGLVLDEQGRKMSKSLGNILDPLDLIEKYGTDAIRLSLVIGTTPGQDTKLSEEKIAGFRNFTNKLWNISRFVLTSVENVTVVDAPQSKTLADKWILSRFARVQEQVTKHLEQFAYSAAGEALRDFTWGDFADWYLEIAKIQKQDPNLTASTDANLLFILPRLLTLWHPFMPFVTEEIWKSFETGSFLMVAAWPEAAGKIDEKAEAEFAKLREIVVDIRNVRAMHKIPPVETVGADIVDAAFAQAHGALVRALARAREVDTATDKTSVATANVVVYLPAVDAGKERARLEKELGELKTYVASTEGKLANAEFASKAPAKVVETMRAKLAEAQAKAVELEKQLKALA